MNHSIYQLSDHAMHILQTATSGKVHSVYRKTINLCIDGQLLSLQAFGSPVSPISLLLDLDEYSMQNLTILEGDSVTITKSSINIGTTAFFYDSAAIFPCTLQNSICGSQIQSMRETLYSILHDSHTEGFDTIFCKDQSDDPSSFSFWLEAAHNILIQTYSFIQARNIADAAGLLHRLVGLGIGLTPSGDDFLCGILAGLKLTGKTDTSFSSLLKENIRSSLGNTNDISRAFLICAFNNRFSMSVHSLGNFPSKSYIQSAFQAIGHSSGIDTLCGIYFILCISEKLF